MCFYGLVVYFLHYEVTVHKTWTNVRRVDLKNYLPDVVVIFNKLAGVKRNFGDLEGAPRV